ncbi:hypothetical protein [Dokdonella sp.]|uniref:hypothetical protein n=1 Tax=Dokdonella sp. TaxID=2291710 RepID=UPI003784BB18
MKPARHPLAFDAIVVLAALAGLANLPARAQTCAAPTPLPADSTVTSFTCGAENFTPPALSGPGAVLRLALDHPVSLDLTLAGIEPQFDPALCVMDAANPCGAGPCLATGNALTPIMLDNLPAGAYWVIVTASPSSAAGSCGMFGLTSQIVPADTILANGFD